MMHKLIINVECLTHFRNAVDATGTVQYGMAAMIDIEYKWYFEHKGHIMHIVSKTSLVYCEYIQGWF